MQYEIPRRLIRSVSFIMIDPFKVENDTFCLRYNLPNEVFDYLIGNNILFMMNLEVTIVDKEFFEYYINELENYVARHQKHRYSLLRERMQYHADKNLYLKNIILDKYPLIGNFEDLNQATMFNLTY